MRTLKALAAVVVFGVFVYLGVRVNYPALKLAHPAVEFSDSIHILVNYPDTMGTVWHIPNALRERWKGAETVKIIFRATPGTQPMQARIVLFKPPESPHLPINHPEPRPYD